MIKGAYSLEELVRERCVLITGAPSFVAIQLLWRILDKEPDTRVHLVVRGDLIQKTEEFVARAPLGSDRVTIHRGSVTDPKFGLHEQIFTQLREQVTDFYHLAAMHHLGAAKQRVEEVNILGTRVALAAAAQFKKLNRFHFYSTAFVCGAREGVILENDLEHGQTFRSTYERTRLTAELDVRRAMKDLPISVYRASLVVGDSQTGEIYWLDGPWIFIQSVARNPERLPTLLPSSIHNPFNAVPVDFVANAMHAISLRPDTEGHTFHLTDPAPVSQASAFRLLRRHIEEGPVLTSFGGRLRDRLLRLPIIEKRTKRVRPFLNELDNLAIFNSSNTLKALRGTDIYCPYFPDYVAALVQYAHEERASLGGNTRDKETWQPV